MKRLSNAKKGNLYIGTALSLSGNEPITKVMKFGKNSYKARHIVIPAKEVESKTVVHHLNLRHQETLTLEAVRDIYSEVLEEGIKQEGVAYFNAELDRYELFDASRRRFCAIKANTDLPLWVIYELPNPKDILAYVELTQKIKLFSWREIGTKYLKFANEQDIDSHNFELIGQEFGVSSETVRKKVNAAKLNKELVESFPDCQGIPTTYYIKLGKIERALTKLNISIEEFISIEKENFKTNATDVKDIQAELLAHYEAKIKEHSVVSSKPQCLVEDLFKFRDKDSYARRKVSSNGRKTVLEFSRIPKDVMSDIESYIRQKLSEKN